MHRTTLLKPESMTGRTHTVLQRACACGQHNHAGGECESCKRKQAELPRGEGQSAPPIVHEVLRSPGQPLCPAARQIMEPRFGRDFSEVRVHTGVRAAESAQEVNALAYTVGKDIVFGTGQYMPMTSVGQRLIGHELAHVVQQEAFGTALSDEIVVGAANDLHERQARQASTNGPVSLISPGGMGAPGALVQRQTLMRAEGPGLLPGLGSFDLPSESVELEAGESLSTKNPKLIRAAQSFKSLQAANPGARIELSAYLTSAAKNSSAKESAERKQLAGRLTSARDVLQSLGVPRDLVDISPPTGYSTSARGQVTVNVYKARPAAPLILGPIPPTAPGKTAPSQPTPGLPGLSDLLTLKFGPLTIELPKSAALKLPIPISAGKKLVVDLKAETSGSFSLSITLDGTRYVRVSIKAGVSYGKEKGATGSAGLQIEMTKTVCSAANPEGLKAKINKAGEDLKKAMQEYSAESDSDKKLMKLADIGGALGEMYDAVDKSKSACKKVPAAKFEFGAKGPLGGESDPSKREPGYIGGTITIPF
jgi:hypothetical protein